MAVRQAVSPQLRRHLPTEGTGPFSPSPQGHHIVVHELNPGWGLGTEPHRPQGPPPTSGYPLGAQHPGESVVPHYLEWRKGDSGRAGGTELGAGPPQGRDMVGGALVDLQKPLWVTGKVSGQTPACPPGQWGDQYPTAVLSVWYS